MRTPLISKKKVTNQFKLYTLKVTLLSPTSPYELDTKNDLSITVFFAYFSFEYHGQVVPSPVHENFMQCMSTQFIMSHTHNCQIIYSSTSPLYPLLLQSSQQNPRWSNSPISTKTPFHRHTFPPFPSPSIHNLQQKPWFTSQELGVEDMIMKAYHISAKPHSS